jgi:hypothetical protein
MTIKTIAELNAWSRSHWEKKRIERDRRLEDPLVARLAYLRVKREMVETPFRLQVSYEHALEGAKEDAREI